MGRALRQNTAGYYHLLNRGVGLKDIFLNRDDKVYFIKLICNYAKEHTYVLHGYALVENGYNILIETKKDNLSNIMKIITARYTYYYNKKYGRRGYLWEGRFKSWHIENESLVLDILAYIEYLPLYAGRVKKREKSYYSCYRQYVGIDQRLSCLYDSIIFKKFNTVVQIKEFFKRPVDVRYINMAHESLKKKNIIENKKTEKKLFMLDKDYFLGLSKTDRNEKIYKIYCEGCSQVQIAKNLGITQQAVHSIIKKMHR